jgi:hypothetical protein
MGKIRLLGWLLILGLVTVGVLGCGTSRNLTAVNVSPSSADAQDFADGVVQFTATGTFNVQPHTAQLGGNDIIWCIGTSQGICNESVFGANIDDNGAAKCDPTFRGTVTVLAGKTKISGPVPGTVPLEVFGSAKLTCP